MKQFIILVVLIALLVGCAPSVRFPPGKGVEDYRLDRTKCANEASLIAGPAPPRYSKDSSEILWSMSYEKTYNNCMTVLGYKVK